MFLPQEVIRKKRDGGILGATEFEPFVAGLVDGSVGEGQAAALAMAICLRGLTLDECVALTAAMTRSGTVLSWALPGPVLDKHSTGGVGDTVSLVLAPAVAACGGYVPMIAGRGLGHTGGTLDKLDAIPGYVSQPDLYTFRRVVRETGCAIIGQTPDIAPADRRLYAIRDVTGTVESLDLITSSILSKKLAAGLGGLVMDVKSGSGAFLPDPAEASALAERLVAVGVGAGLPTVALLTDMDQPLASVAGNALETAYAIDYLAGARREARFHEVTLELGAAMLRLGGLASDEAEGRAKIEEAIASGRAAEVFARMVAALGGPADLLERAGTHLAEAPIRRPVAPASRGFVTGIDVRALGIAVVALGGGRVRAQDAIDHAVGLTDLAPLGAAVDTERPLAIVHARSEDAVRRAIAALQAAYTVGGQPPPARRTITDRISPDDLPT
jgi:thymidine phosphorylase